MNGDKDRHVPVLLDEVLSGLAIRENSLVVDGTFGRGGHSRAILATLGQDGRLLALDRDPESVCSASAVDLRGDRRFELEHTRYSQLADVVTRRGWYGSVNGILLDLGVSSPQLDESERGFSFLRDGPLDMRMDNSSGLTAANWLARVTEQDLYTAISELGEDRYARRIARAIVAFRGNHPLETTAELARLIEQTVPTREPGKHPATRTFQAIRIAINQELEELDAALHQATDVLAPGGRLAVIAFHSLEDRRVKRFMRDEERGGQLTHSRLPLPANRPLRLKRVGKAITPCQDEIRRNPRARSAILRIAERVSS